MATAVEKVKSPKYLFQRGNQYYYIRNIAPRYRHKFGNQKQVWESLKTSDFSKAVVLLQIKKHEHDAIISGEVQSRKPVSFHDEIRHAEALGIERKSSAEIRLESMERSIALMADRIQLALSMKNPTALDVATLAGASEEPALTIWQAFKMFLEIEVDFLLGPAPQRWLEDDNKPDWDDDANFDDKQKVLKYIRSLQDFIDRCGDIDVLKIDKEIADDYVLSVKKDVVAKKFTSLHGTRNIGQTRQVIKKVLAHFYKRDFTLLDGKSIKLKRDDAGKREAFTEAEVRAIETALPTWKMSDEAKAIIQLALITGAGPKELCWLTESDIRADAATSYIKIGPNALRDFVKTGKDRHRDLPIATEEGIAILKQFPQGFKRFHATNGSSKLNKELSPFFTTVTPGKSLYCARHRLEDLMKAGGVDLGMRAAIKGHSLGKHLAYYGKSGNGYTLADKKEALQKALAAAPIKEQHENEV